MTTFGVIAEGVTDQVVLDAIISCFCETDCDQIFVNPLQPLRDATDASRAVGFGGWELVFEYCADAKRVLEALSANDYLVIQIDTDCSEHPNFNVQKTTQGRAKSVSLFVSEIEKVLKLKLGNNYSQYKDRIIFAVSVHSLECWLLAFYAVNKGKKEKTENCQHHLNSGLTRQGIRYNKDAKCYRSLSDKIITRKSILASAKRCESLSIFIQRLPNQNSS